MSRESARPDVAIGWLLLLLAAVLLVSGGPTGTRLRHGQTDGGTERAACFGVEDGIAMPISKGGSTVAWVLGCRLSGSV
jgi:hypothetical protein